MPAWQKKKTKASQICLKETEKLVDVAKEHMKIHENLKIDYVCDTVENLSVNNKEKFDAVTFFDVAEHVADVRQVLKASVDCFKPGGRIFITCWNKTFMGWFYGIFLLQWILGIVPPGACSYHMFRSACSYHMRRFQNI